MIFLYEILNDPINQNLNDKQGAQLDGRMWKDYTFLTGNQGKICRQLFFKFQSIGGDLDSEQ